jgi:hypothetical protein
MRYVSDTCLTLLDHARLVHRRVFLRAHPATHSGQAVAAFAACTPDKHTALSGNLLSDECFIGAGHDEQRGHRDCLDRMMLSVFGGGFENCFELATSPSAKMVY